MPVAPAALVALRACYTAAGEQAENEDMEEEIAAIRSSLRNIGAYKAAGGKHPNRTAWCEDVFLAVYQQIGALIDTWHGTGGTTAVADGLREVVTGCLTVKMQASLGFAGVNYAQLARCYSDLEDADEDEDTDGSRAGASMGGSNGQAEKAVKDEVQQFALVQNASVDALVSLSYDEIQDAVAAAKLSLGARAWLKGACKRAPAGAGLESARLLDTGAGVGPPGVGLTGAGTHGTDVDAQAALQELARRVGAPGLFGAKQIAQAPAVEQSGPSAARGHVETMDATGLLERVLAALEALGNNEAPGVGTSGGTKGFAARQAQIDHFNRSPQQRYDYVLGTMRQQLGVTLQGLTDGGVVQAYFAARVPIGKYRLAAHHLEYNINMIDALDRGDTARARGLVAGSLQFLEQYVLDGGRFELATLLPCVPEVATDRYSCTTSEAVIARTADPRLVAAMTAYLRDLNNYQKLQSERCADKKK